MMKAWLMLGLVAAAGCLGGQPATVGAMEAADASHASAQGEFEYLLFLGITGTEGPLNWTLYEEALQTFDPGQSIAEAFDQDVENGELGNGKLASWLSTHFVFDESKRLLGGLYTQYTTEHGLRTVYAPFRGPYAGTVALPGLQMALLGPQVAVPELQARGAPEEPVLCGLVSHTNDWHVDSAQAARIATGRPIMQDHVAQYPEGEFTYYYFPRLDVEPGCPGRLDATSNHWTISHADLDAYLTGGDPTIAEVRIDAATGEVLAESVRPLAIRPPMVLDEVIIHTDPLVPKRVVQNVTVPVEQGSKRMELNVLRVEAPDYERSAMIRLRDPTGLVVEQGSLAHPVYWYIDGPAAGTWTVEYVHQSLEPLGQHEVHVRAIVHT